MMSSKRAGSAFTFYIAKDRDERFIEWFLLLSLRSWLFASCVLISIIYLDSSVDSRV